MTVQHIEEQPDQQLETVRVLISQALTSVDSMLVDVRLMFDASPRGLGFATADAKQAMDEQIRRERKDRHWNQVRGYYVGTGEMPAQGNLRAWALDVEIHMVLAGQVRRMVRHLSEAGYQVTHRIPPEPTTRQLVTATRTLSWHVESARLLTRVHAQVEYLAGEMKRLLDGFDRLRLNDACPHCGRDTLVVYLSGDDEGTIRCGPDPKTGEFETCVCPHEDCDCKTNTRHRHEWYRDKGTARDGWWTLRDRLNLKKQIHH